jgi:signal transduction histidine kinase
VSLLALVVILWGLSGQRDLAGLPAGFAPERLVYPVRVNGVPAASAGEVRFLVQGERAGEMVRIESATDILEIRLERDLSPFHLAIVVASALWFWAFATFVFAPRMDAGPIRDFYWSTLLYGASIAIGGVYFPGASIHVSALLGFLQIACLAFIPVVFLHLALIFPRRRALLDRAPALFPALFLVAVLAIGWQTLAFLRYFEGPSPAAWRATKAPQLLADLLLVGQVAAGILALSLSSRRVEMARERQQVKWVLWGIAIGASPYVFLRTLPGLVGVQLPIPAAFDRLFELAIPIAYTFAVVRYKFLDIDVIIRRSLISALLAFTMVGTYLLLGVLIGRRLGPALPESSRSVSTVVAIAAVVAVAMFHPMKRVIGAWVDRTFFKIQYSYVQAIRSFRVRIAEASSPQEIAEAVLRCAGENLEPKISGAVVRIGQETFACGDIDPGLVERCRDRLDAILRTDGTPVAAANATSQADIERHDFPVELLDAGLRLVQPLVVEGRSMGLLFLGEKRSERRYIEQDIDLLRAAGAESAVVLERLELVRNVAEEALERRRLDEINRMKSDFLSWIAHDLKTPLTSIGWSAQNLLDGVLGELSPRQCDYLLSIRASTTQLGRLVSNLLEVSRLEQGEARIETGPVVLAGLADEAILGLRPIASERDVTLTAETDPGLGPVRGNREKILEILINLVDNAVRYSPDHGAVEITVGRDGEGWQQISVRDHGPGLSPDDREAVFLRFHQGAPSPYAHQHGVGLGLYVVKTYVELLGGEISAANHPDGGALFVCRLREWAAGEGARA